MRATEREKALVAHFRANWLVDANDDVVVTLKDPGGLSTSFLELFVGKVGQQRE